MLYYIVWSGLRAADPKPHERIAIIGIGGLGHLDLQFSKASGFETIAITHSKDKEELSLKLGANQVVTNGEELISRRSGCDTRYQQFLQASY